MKFLRANWLPFVLWIEVSLLAIAFIGDKPYLGLAIAVLGGVALGWVGIASTRTLPAPVPRQRSGGVAGEVEPQEPPRGRGSEHLPRKLIQAAEWIATHELWFLALPIALLILPHRTAPWGLIVISLLWPIRWVARRRITVRTPVDAYILGLLVMIPVALYASVDLAMSRIILYQILAGVALFYGLVNVLRSERDVWRMAFLLVLGGGGIVLIAPLGTTWHMSKLFNLPGVYERFPRLLPDLIHPNVLAGALVLIIPIGISLLRTSRNQNSPLGEGPSPSLGEGPSLSLGEGLRPSPHRLRSGDLAELLRWVYKLALALALALMLAITALTQSRGAYTALAVGTLLFAIIVNRWLIILSLVAGLGLAVAIQRVGIETLADLLLTTSVLQGRAGRLEVWSRAIYMIQDFPYTGGGLGTFGKVVPVMYPYFLAGPDADVPHAHDLFLQVAVDLGLPGLVAFVGLFSGALIAAWKAYRTYGARKEIGPQSLALGLLVSLIIMGIHGLTDSVTWAPARPSIIPWCIMGLTMALYRVSEEGRGRRED